MLQYHQPSYEPVGHPERTCLYDAEAWPCERVQAANEAFRTALAKVADMPTMNGGVTLDLDTLDRVADVIKGLIK